jgi:ribosomal protein S18 acetylase RimI-like enzyme
MFRRLIAEQLLSRLSAVFGYCGAMPANPAQLLQITRCDPARDFEILELAARAWPEAERAAYHHGIQQLIQCGLANHIALIAAKADGCALVAQLAQALPGRAAIAWPPQFSDAESAVSEQTIADLAVVLGHILQQADVQIAQALLPCGDQRSEQSLTVGGFSHAADLLYLAADPSSFEPPVRPLPFDLEPFQPSSLPRLIDVVQRTYVQTLDCPQMDGLRETADVIAGYQALGTYLPELWLFVRYGGRDVGCLLINLHPDVQHAEIVYVGLAPEVRGRGWGLLLTHEALRLANSTKSRQAVLAVDAANQPALQMYFDAGFQVFDRRAVWLKTFPREAQAIPG